MNSLRFNFSKEGQWKWDCTRELISGGDARTARARTRIYGGRRCCMFISLWRTAPLKSSSGFGSSAWRRLLVSLMREPRYSYITKTPGSTSQSIPRFTPVSLTNAALLNTTISVLMGFCSWYRDDVEDERLAERRRTPHPARLAMRFIRLSLFVRQTNDNNERTKKIIVHVLSIMCIFLYFW